MPVADTSYSILDNPTTSGGGGGGGTDLNFISSRNTIEVEREGDTVDLNVAGDSTRNFLVKNFNEFMDAVKTCGELYVGGDKTQNVIQLLDHIDMTSPTADDEAYYVVEGNPLIDRTNMRYNFTKYLWNTKIVSYGQTRALQLMCPNQSNTALDTWQIKVIRFFCENLSIGGEIATWKNYFKHNPSLPGNLPVQYQRYLLASDGNLYYDFKDCNITCCGAAQGVANSYNPFVSMGSSFYSDYGLWASAFYMKNCMFISGRDTGGNSDGNLNAPIVINSNFHENRRKILSFKQMAKQVNATSLETGVPNIQIRSDVDYSTNWQTYKWEVSTDGTSLISCQFGINCMTFSTHLALNDLYIQGQPTLQPEGATNTYDWVSLVDVLNVILGDKLGYWTGTTANLPPTGSREANKLYITTD